MDNASRILTTLDGHLDHPVRLVLYGRAALQLGFSDAPPEVAKSKDEFLIQREKPTETELTEAFSVMRPIELAELRDAFMRAKPVVLKLIKANLSK